MYSNQIQRVRQLLALLAVTWCGELLTMHGARYARCCQQERRPRSPKRVVIDCTTSPSCRLLRLLIRDVSLQALAGNVEWLGTVVRLMTEWQRAHRRELTKSRQCGCPLSYASQLRRTNRGRMHLDVFSWTASKGKGLRCRSQGEDTIGGVEKRREDLAITCKSRCWPR